MESIRFAALVGALFTVVACGGGGSRGDVSTPTAPTAPPPPPANIAIQSAAVASEGSADEVTVKVANTGGSGQFYIEFWGEPISTTPTGCFAQPGQSCPHPPQQLIGTSQTVTVTAGYSEGLVYTVPPTVSTVKVLTQPVNTAIFSQTACSKVRDFGVCP